MKHLAYLFFVLCLLLISATIKAESVPTDIKFTDSYLSGREMSKKADKPLLVYFYDIDKSSYSTINDLWNDTEVSEIVAQNYICSRVNIHYFDGETLKKYHKIDEAPALILLSPTGKVLRRINSEYNKEELIAFLQGVSQPASKNKVDEIEENMDAKPSPIEAPHYEKPTAKVSKTESHTGFTIQVGVFGSRENAAARVAELERIFNEPVRFIPIQQNSKELYRVCIGNFNTEADSRNYLKLVTKYGIEGLVKSLPL